MVQKNLLGEINNMGTNIDLTKQVIMLFAKVGVFFMECDGNVDEREVSFIKKYISELKDNPQLSPAFDDELNVDLQKTLKAHFDFEQIKEEFKFLISKASNDNERNEVITIFNNFILKVIDADTVVQHVEQEYYKKWVDTFKIAIEP